METMDISPRLYKSKNVPSKILEAARPFEARFGTTFCRFYVFSKDLLGRLHSNVHMSDEREKLVVASREDESVSEALHQLTNIANSRLRSSGECKAYLKALIEVYDLLPRKPSGGDGVLTVAPEREGRILAERMGWFKGDSIAPNLKRIPFESGLIVASTDIDSSRQFEQCNIIDGAIASGATVMCIIDSLKDQVKRFHIFSVHSATQGLSAILSYSNFLKVHTAITVGHATNGLNDKYYAIVPDHTSLVVVGDLGDTIAPVAESTLSK